MENKSNVLQKTPKVTLSGLISLSIAILIFSGILASLGGPLKAFDFSTLVGSFGKITDFNEKAREFRGAGGSGAKDGFLFAMTLLPGCMTALGIVSVVESFGGLETGAALLTGLLRFVMGIPGICSLALVGSLSSSDAGAAMTLDLVDKGHITPDERDIFVSFQFAGSGLINNYFSSGSALFPVISVASGIPLLVIFALKFVGANLLRFLIVYPAARKNANKEGGENV